MPAIYVGDKIKLRGDRDKRRIEEIDWEGRKVKVSSRVEWVPFSAIERIIEPVIVNGRWVS